MKMMLMYLLLFSVVSCSSLSRVESNFLLVGSRMPVWYENQYGVANEELEIFYTFYTNGEAKVLIRARLPKRDVYDELEGRYEGEVTGRAPKVGGSDFPHYFKVRVRGLSDVYEVRKMGPYIYVVDDPDPAAERPR